MAHLICVQQTIRHEDVDIHNCISDSSRTLQILSDLAIFTNNLKVFIEAYIW